MSTTRIKGSGGVIIESTRYLELPKGEESQRGSVSRPGMIRYNFDEKNTNKRGVQVAIGNEPASGEESVIEWRTIAVLNEQGQLDTSLLPAAIQGSLDYVGPWDATKPIPTDPGSAGRYYIVSVDGSGTGSSNLHPGEAPYKIGDWVVSTGEQWDKINYNATATTSAAVTLDPAGMRPNKMGQETATTVLRSLEQIVDAGLDRLNDDQVEGTITFNNESSKALLRIKDGSISAPGISFSTETTLGLYRKTSNDLRVTASNTDVMSFENAQVQVFKAMRSINGTSTLPQYSFTSDTDSGMYRVGENAVGMSTGGVNRVTITNEGTYIRKTLLDDGTEAEPSYTFASDNDTGLYSAGENILGFTTSGTSRLVLNNNAADFNVKIKTVPGSPTVPSYTFASDNDTGIYSPGSDQFGITTGGVLRLLTTTTSHVSNLPFHAVTGTPQAPAYSFDGYSNMGMYRHETDAVSIASAGSEIVRFHKDQIDSYKVQRGINGTVTTPTYTWSSDPSTGMFRPTDGTIAFTSNGKLMMSINNESITTDSLTIPAGTSTEPSLRFINDLHSGLYSPDASSVGITVDSLSKLVVYPDQVQISVPICAVKSTPSSVSYGFTGDNDTGMYNIGENRLGFASGGSLRLELNNTTAHFKTSVLAPTGAINADASVSRASFGFNSDENTGMYSPDENVVALMTEGIERVKVTTSDIISSVPYRGVNGSDTAPQFSFTNSPKSGMFCAALDQVGISANAVEVARFANTVVSINKQLKIATDQRIFWDGGASRYTSITSQSAGSKMRLEASDAEIPFSFGKDSAEYFRIAPHAIKVPHGTASQVATPEDGMIQYDTVTDTIMGFYQSKWQDMSGGGKLRKDGTVTAPALYWESDTNTGLYRSGNDSIGVTTGGIERMCFSTSVNQSNQRLSIKTPTGTLTIGSNNTTGMHFESDRNFHFNKPLRVVGDVVLDGHDTKFDYDTGNVMQNGKWLNDIYFTNNGIDSTNVDVMIKDPTYNGVYDRINTGPVGYNSGALVNLSSTTSNLQLYAPHKEGAASALYFRTGNDDVVMEWKRVLCVGDSISDSDSLNGIHSSQFLRSDIADTMKGQLSIDMDIDSSIDKSLADAWTLIGTSNNGLGIDRTTIANSGDNLHITSLTHGIRLKGSSITHDSPTLVDNTLLITGKITSNAGINIANDQFITMGNGSNNAIFGFNNTDDSNSYVFFQTRENINDYFKFSSRNVSNDSKDWMNIKSTGIVVSGNTSLLGDFQFNNQTLSIAKKSALLAQEDILNIGSGYTTVTIHGTVNVDKIRSTELTATLDEITRDIEYNSQSIRTLQHSQTEQDIVINSNFSDTNRPSINQVTGTLDFGTF